LVPAVEEAQAHMRAGWMWRAIAGQVSVFLARELLENRFAGIVVSDRHGSKRHAAWFCWAHLLRDFAKNSKRSGEAKLIGYCVCAARRHAGNCGQVDARCATLI